VVVNLVSFDNYCAVVSIINLCCRPYSLEVARVHQNGEREKFVLNCYSMACLCND